jgi:hypothetical protein
MPAKQNRKKQLDAFRAGQEKAAAAQRKLCSYLMFWKFCGHKKCLRERACAVDGKDCFDRFWPLLPEEIKISVRTEIKAAKARLSSVETMAAIERDLARWRESMAPRAVPQAPPIARAVPRAPDPRLRVL